MRFVVAFVLACALTAVLVVGGARIAVLVSGPEPRPNDFTVGQRRDLCGYEVDARYAIAGYRLDVWQGARCHALSDHDHCVLACLRDAGTVSIAARCSKRCADEEKK